MERESSLGGRLRRLMEEEGLSYEQLGEPEAPGRGG